MGRNKRGNGLQERSTVRVQPDQMITRTAKAVIAFKSWYTFDAKFSDDEYPTRT